MFSSSRHRVTRATSKSALVLGLLVGGVASACSNSESVQNPVEPDDLTAALAEDGNDSASAETDSELVVGSLVAGTPLRDGSLGLSSTDDLTSDGTSTKGIGDGAKAIYFPRGCVSVTSDEAKREVAYTFTQCAGPVGIYKITGEIRAHYTASPGKLELDITGAGLTVNRASVDWHANATITANGAAREMKWSAQLTGTTKRGRAFSRSNEKTLSWRFGDSCFSVAGSSSGTVKEREIRTEISGFTRCRAACPEAGGRIAITDVAKQKTVEITFDGSAKGTFVAANGKTSTFPLLCQAAD